VSQRRQDNLSLHNLYIY